MAIRAKRNRLLTLVRKSQDETRPTVRYGWINLIRELKAQKQRRVRRITL